MPVCAQRSGAPTHGPEWSLSRSAGDGRQAEPTAGRRRRLAGGTAAASPDRAALQRHRRAAHRQTVSERRWTAAEGVLAGSGEDAGEGAEIG